MIERDIGREVRTFREIGLVLASSIAEPTELWATDGRVL